MVTREDLSGLLEEITRRIRTMCSPERIILFGSHARGDTDLDSDLDLLVIMNDVTHSRQESTRIRRALRGLLVPIDIIVATPEQIARYGDSPLLVYGPALREGRVLYERQPAA